MPITYPELAAELFEASRRGVSDEDARMRMSVCVGRLEPEIRRLVTVTLACKRASLLRANVDIDDAVQDVLTKMVQGKLPSGDDARQPERVLASWVRVVASNWFASAMRRAKFRGDWPSADKDDAAQRFEESVPAPPTPDALEDVDLAVALETCAARLGGKRRLLWDTLLRNPDASVPELAVGLGYVARADQMTPKVRDAVYAVRREMRALMAGCLEQAGVLTSPISGGRR